MSTTFLTPSELIKCREKFGKGNLFDIDLKKMRDNSKTSGKNSDRFTRYIPILCKNLTGKLVPLKLKFNKQIIAANIKARVNDKDEKSADANKIPGDVNLTFKKLSAEDLEISEYKQSDHPGLLASNEEFIQACEIIDEEYTAVVSKKILGPGVKISLKNDTLRTIRQVYRNASDEEVAEDEKKPEEERVVVQVGREFKIALPQPFIRFKIKVDTTSGKIGFQSKDRGFSYTIFDMRKSSTPQGYNPVPAKLLSNGKPVDLTYKNVKNFGTFLSLVNGTITFDSICLSTSGISLKNSVYPLQLLRHKPMKQEAFDDEEKADMARMASEYATTDEPVDEPANQDEENNEQEENTEQEEMPEEFDESVNEKPIKLIKKSLPTKQVVKPTPVKPVKAVKKPVEAEPEENEVDEKDFDSKVEADEPVEEKQEDEENNEAEQTEATAEDLEEENNKKTKPLAKPVVKPAAKAPVKPKTGGTLKKKT